MDWNEIDRQSLKTLRGKLLEYRNIQPASPSAQRSFGAEEDIFFMRGERRGENAERTSGHGKK